MGPFWTLVIGMFIIFVIRTGLIDIIMKSLAKPTTET